MLWDALIVWRLSKREGTSTKRLLVLTASETISSLVKIEWLVLARWWHYEGRKQNTLLSVGNFYCTPVAKHFHCILLGPPQLWNISYSCESKYVSGSCRLLFVLKHTVSKADVYALAVFRFLLPVMWLLMGFDMFIHFKLAVSSAVFLDVKIGIDIFINTWIDLSHSHIRWS